MESDFPQELETILNLPGNNKCFDCGKSNPKWAGINYGILLCLECCGKHRALGTHISFIRSLELDKWKKNHVDLMIHGGNEKATEFFTSHDICNLPINDKYNHPYASLYSSNLFEEVGIEVPPYIKENSKKDPTITKCYQKTEETQNNQNQNNKDENNDEDNLLFGCLKTVFSYIFGK
ncbi:ARF GAP-like zinc finger-containing protein [Tritrichomonas foetus]|uniref:ARF GAP-like zinc finger-containing protein n=1 Tax=Tritrichomonas foetus TaxID=1144522 RepID=A0A1J4JL29_9EUKA|nr:ARF GAP-like zinc finger-containing protein [Tritrichomonas foetus]|eukprot:OHS99798.1 ARF GAP-like zinc finger-containing protein [Tritrichomonas foetus]